MNRSLAVFLSFGDWTLWPCRSKVHPTAVGSAAVWTAALLWLGSCNSDRSSNDAGVLIDRTASSGIDFVHRRYGTGKKYLVEINGGSVAFLDYDSDGRLDVAFGQSAPLDGSEMPPGGSDRLYRNQGNRQFRDVTEEAAAAEPGYTLSIAAPDYDGDGDQDLYFCNFRRNTLLRNDGGRFVDVTEASGLGSPRWTSSAVFADFDQDGDLDVYLCNYVIDDLNHPGCGNLERGEEWRSYCDPGVFPGSSDQLFQNDDGVFVDVTSEAGMHGANGNGLAGVISDFDLDGDVDLFVANDQTPNFLWRNEGSMKFTNIAPRAGVAVGDLGASEACMGTDWADVDLDGDFDLIAANLTMETNTLYNNQGGGMFADQSRMSGLGPPSLLQVGFGCEFFDVDHDMDADLMVANGHVLDNIHLYEPSQSYRQPPQLYRNEGGARFQEISLEAGSYFGERRVGRGLGVADLDNDGDLDVVVANNNGPSDLLENQMSLGRSWIGFQLRAKGKNTAALGALVTVRIGDTKLIEEVRGTSSYAAYHDQRVHFGLDSHETVDEVLVRWPDGTVTNHGPMDAREYHWIEQE